MPGTGWRTLKASLFVFDVAISRMAFLESQDMFLYTPYRLDHGGDCLPFLSCWVISLCLAVQELEQETQNDPLAPGRLSVIVENPELVDLGVDTLITLRDRQRGLSLPLLLLYLDIPPPGTTGIAETGVILAVFLLLDSIWGTELNVFFSSLLAFPLALAPMLKNRENPSIIGAGLEEREFPLVGFKSDEKKPLPGRFRTDVMYPPLSPSLGLTEINLPLVL